MPSEEGRASDLLEASAKQPNSGQIDCLDKDGAMLVTFIARPPF